MKIEHYINFTLFQKQAGIMVMTFRITTDGLVTANANGVASNGEVEDYFIPFEKPLPVTLISFTAIESEGTVVLSWETTQKTNSDRFEIQRSRDAKAWFVLGSVKAKVASSKHIHTQICTRKRVLCPTKTCTV
ncbi:hypothetical protein [Dyadobacter sp. 22481]|uniref:hypothetical protein n=1 Tax=Dyadobacter sp. 22481 TaxID=3453926 RepID=UPI003F83BD3C